MLCGDLGNCLAAVNQIINAFFSRANKNKEEWEFAETI